MAWLINASQLDKFRKNQKSVAIFDASWHLPSAGRDAKQEFTDTHISGARFFDFARFHDAESILPNMLIRDEAELSQSLNELGITPEHKIIFYDNSELHTSCRALWMMQTFGHNTNQLYILDGGLPAWLRYGGKMESGESKQVTPKPYPINFIAHNVRTLLQMKTNLHHPTEQVVDMRHPIRYAGGKDASPDIRPGHIPGSFSFPYQTMFELEGRFRPLERIRRQLTGIGVCLEYPIVTTCGSGMTATILNFVLGLLNQEQNALYDGSWSEWGRNTLYHGEADLSERPVVTSLDK